MESSNDAVLTRKHSSLLAVLSLGLAAIAVAGLELVLPIQDLLTARGVSGFFIILLWAWPLFAAVGSFKLGKRALHAERSGFTWMAKLAVFASVTISILLVLMLVPVAILSRSPIKPHRTTVKLGSVAAVPSPPSAGQAPH